MTADELMAGRAVPLGLVIFDCDGVLVDSEPTVNRLVAEDLTARGWKMTTAEATERFLGLTLPDTRRLAEARLGRAMPPTWVAIMESRIAAAMALEAVAVPGAVEVLSALTAMGMPWRVASNSSHAEMQAKFARLGIGDLVAGRLHSYSDVKCGKPAPDLFLAAAAAQGVAAQACVVVEDSVPGIRGAITAGMDCLGFARGGDSVALSQAGAVPFDSMADLPGLIAAGMAR
jgi:HAD superfamily hydrolase (TIGR01509 family)